MALREELEGSRQSIKMLVRWTGASERTVQNWLGGVRGPSGPHPVALAKQSLDCVRRRPSSDHSARSSAGPRDLSIAASACSIVRHRLERAHEIDLGLTRPRLLVSSAFWRSQINGIARILSEDRRITTPPTAERPRTYHVKPQYWIHRAGVAAMASDFPSEKCVTRQDFKIDYRLPISDMSTDNMNCL